MLLLFFPSIKFHDFFSSNDEQIVPFWWDVFSSNEMKHIKSRSGRFFSLTYICTCSHGSSFIHFFFLYFFSLFIYLFFKLFSGIRNLTHLQYIDYIFNPTFSDFWLHFGHLNICSPLYTKSAYHVTNSYLSCYMKRILCCF